MRTTLTLDEDVGQQIERRMRERGTTLKATINDLLRRGLRNDVAPSDYQVRTYHAQTTPGLDLTKALALAAALEDDEILRKIELGK